MEVSDQPHIPATVCLGKELPVSIEWEARWPQGNSGHSEDDKDILSLSGFYPSIIHPVA